jgi:hypothetical protein
MATDTYIPQHDAASGLDRRSLIKRAAAVGAAAWTAPVIIGSLASPAGALTTVTCTFTQWDIDRDTCTFAGFTNAQDCVPPVQPNCTTADIGPTDFCTAQGGITIACPTTNSLRLTIPPTCSCVFIVGVAKGTGQGGCSTGTISAGGKQVDFSWPADSASRADRVSFYINC